MLRVSASLPLMTHDHRGARLATFTIAVLVIYAPIETWYSMPELWDPFYLVDFAGIVLLSVGVVGLRRGPAPRWLGMLIAGYAWTATNFWRALFGRVQEVTAGRRTRLWMGRAVLHRVHPGRGPRRSPWALLLSVRLSGPAVNRALIS
jgi:hypothetical protein